MNIDTPERKLIKMMQYVEQEGYEKADEISAKAEDEFNMEKRKLIREACEKIDQEYIIKRKKCKQKMIMELTMITSSNRKELIRVKQRAIDDLLVQIKEIIATDMKCPTGRWAVLQPLILEGLFKLLEDKVVIQCRKQDVEIIQKYIPELETAYYERAKKRVSLSIDSIHLPNDPLPGIILLVKEGRIILNNALRDRINQIHEYFIPVISSIFYETKKFDSTISYFNIGFY